MPENVENFYVIDFDRCLGNVDASFSLLQSIIGEMGLVSSDEFAKVRADTEARGESFTVFGYLKAYTTDQVTQQVVDEFIRRGKDAASDSLLEAGAQEFINWLDKNHKYYGIMSYGDRIWQPTKIAASGLGKVACMIVDNPQKASVITTWRNKANGQYELPQAFGGYTTSEIILIDDKATAFDMLPEGTRGYWVVKDGHTLPFQQGIVPSVITRVEQINQIINLEQRRHLF